MFNVLINLNREHHEEHFCKTILNFGFRPVVQEEKLFKDISYLELWQPFCQMEWNHLCNFGRRHNEEQFCEIVLNLDQLFIW